MKNYILILLVVLTGSLLLQGQVIETDAHPSLLKKNSVFGHVGMIHPFLGGSASVSYDRSVYIDRNTSDIRARLSIGMLGIIGGGYRYQSLTMGIVTGRRNHHFELFAGGALNQYTPGPSHGDPDHNHHQESELGFFPVGNIGYRYQKPDGWFIFRAGVGFPDLVYLGVGVAF